MQVAQTSIMPGVRALGEGEIDHVAGSIGPVAAVVIVVAVAVASGTTVTYSVSKDAIGGDSEGDSSE